MASCLRRVVLLYSILACFIQTQAVDNAKDRQSNRVRRAALNPEIVGNQDDNLDQIAAQNNFAQVQQRFPAQPQAAPNQQQQQANLLHNQQPQLGAFRPHHDNAVQQLGGFRQPPDIAVQQDAFQQQPDNQQFHQAINPAQQNLNPNMAGMRKERPSKFQSIMLAERPECEDDIRRLCSSTLRKNNFAILDCLQADLEEEDRISERCQHLVWVYKRNLTRDDRFESAGQEVCAKEFNQLPECAQLDYGKGKRIPCMIEHMANITGSCKQYLNKMATIVFGDYHYVWHFMEDCGDEVTQFGCGRLDNKADEDNKEGNKEEEKLHAQGQTIVCLAGVVTKLSQKCKKQVLRVAELQADDYHLDRPLYYACRDAREKFCERVQAGDGKVFECLFNHKNDPEMGGQCTRMLVIRQQLIAEDVKVEKTFFTACQEDIIRYQCFTGTEQDADRSTILRCLENALKQNHPIKHQCMLEMTEMRRSLMSDYEITPEIVTKCHAEIMNLCGGGRLHGGKTLHCLMENAQAQWRKQAARRDPFSHECRAALESLLLEADVAENVQVDRVLAEACNGVIQTVCKNAGKEGIINCLMEKIDHDLMTDDCEDRLIEIQYFLVRDFRLKPHFYRICHQDAVSQCGASPDWFDVNRASVDNSPEIFSCLYRHIKDDLHHGQISKPCREEVRYVMRMRAKRVNLDPDIEEACLGDLGLHCSDMDVNEKDAEISCLQKAYDDLSDECQDAVGNFTEDEDEDLELDTILMRACTPMIKKFCEGLLDHDAEASEVMDCLIEHKHNKDMNEKCASGVEHHQLIQLKDFRFTHKFKEACKKSVTRYCSNMNKKSQIVTCLSEIVRNDILTEANQRIGHECQRQLRVEVMHRGESIDLDPELKKACEDDVDRLCGSKHSGNAQVIECLKSQQKNLSQQCHMLLFKREKTETNLGDYSLFTVCKSMIKRYCSVAAAEDVLDCLRRRKNTDDFDPTCRAFVMKRQLQEAKDYRLNPSLAKACRLDIPKFCKDITTSEDNDLELEGRVINCLKKQFIKKMLSHDCHTEIRSLIKETALNINLDPVLVKACEQQVRRLCSKQAEQYEAQANRVEFAQDQDVDPVEECLKQKLYEGKIEQASPCAREIQRLVEEAHVDVNVDPQLHMACQSDLLRWCRDIVSGEGQQMTCLLTVLEEYPDKMKSKCNKLLTQRKTLWEYAAKSAPAESLSELGQQVLESPSKAYLLGVIVTIIGIIFIVGITCGRVTKRVTAEMKNK